MLIQISATNVIIFIDSIHVIAGKIMSQYNIIAESSEYTVVSEFKRAPDCTVPVANGFFYIATVAAAAEGLLRLPLAGQIFD